MIWHVQNENFILDSTRIFMKAFHLLLFHGSFIFPECILIFGLILLLMIDSTSDQKDRPWFYFISSTSLVMSITALFFRWREEPNSERMKTVPMKLVTIFAALNSGKCISSKTYVMRLFPTAAIAIISNA